MNHTLSTRVRRVARAAALALGCAAFAGAPGPAHGSKVDRAVAPAICSFRRRTARDAD